jgi:L-iditol 2-dehydrogenase
MKAAVLYGREDVRIEQVEVPALEPGDVLLRTRVALTCGTDAKVFRRGYHEKMIVPPAVFGHEMAGIVEEVAPGVESFEPGMAVVAANSAPCGDCYYCRHEMPSLCDDLLFWNGAYAEFARIPGRVVRKNLIPLEEGVSFREAAMVEPLACVVRGIEESWIGRGQSVAVIGAGPLRHVHTEGRLLLNALADEIGEDLRLVARVVITDHLMSIALPHDRPLRLGSDAVTGYPDVLSTLTNPDLLSLLREYNATPDAPSGSAAVDWSVLSQRLHFIADFFRGYQEDLSLFEPPFGPTQPS